MSSGSGHGSPVRIAVSASPAPTRCIGAHSWRASRTSSGALAPASQELAHTAREALGEHIRIEHRTAWQPAPVDPLRLAWSGVTTRNSYGDIYSGHTRARKPVIPTVPADRDLVVEDAATGFCGAVVGFEKTYDGDFVRLEDGRRRTRLFAMREAAFLLDGKPVTLVKPKPKPPTAGPTRSASGSTKVEGLRARVALGSRIWVEGVHDAALVERVWGHDLRVEGVVVEQLEGLDNLGPRLAEFGPAKGHKVGVLVDHLVAGSKETNLTTGLGEFVLVTGHPYIDVWQAVKPASAAHSLSLSSRCLPPCFKRG